MPTENAVDAWVMGRARELGMSVSELCRRASISRQTLYDLALVPDKLPSLQTVVALAAPLQVHPLRILHLIFDRVPTAAPARRAARGDRSSFVRDVSHADGDVVLAGQQFVKVWELHNAGSVAWEGRWLQCMDDEVVVLSRHGEQLRLAEPLQPQARRVPVPSTKPGASVQVAVGFKAPHAPGTVVSYWKMAHADGRLCFPRARGVWVKVQVQWLGSPTDAEGAVSQG